MDWKEILNHPITFVATIVATVGQLGIGWVEPVWATISATSSYWFPVAAATAGTIMPNIGYSDLGTTVLIGATILYVGVKLDGLIEYLRNRRNA